MILDHKKIVIFGYPRSATKLLAKVLVDFGYHNYGEWYDVWSSKIVGNSAVRLPTKEIQNIKETSKQNMEKFLVDQCNQAVDLEKLWKTTHTQLNPDAWTLTLWPNNLGNFPFVLDQLRDCFWLCPTRDRWTHLLSWYVSSINSNFNGEIESKPVTVSKFLFNKTYWQLRRTDLSQKWILNNFSGMYVPFEELTTGTFKGFGKDYIVNSKDEHTSLESLIKNINEIRDWFTQAENEPWYPVSDSN